MIRKAALITISIIAVVCLLWCIHAIAAPYPTGVGGTGTAAAPQAGQVLVGTGSGTYTPAYLLCAGTCSVSSVNGTITITGTGVASNTGNWAGPWQLYNPSDFLSSSTQYVTSVNGGSGVVTITSSTLGVIWPTVNGVKAASYGITATNGATSTLSGATTTISVSLNNGSAVTCSANQFLNTISATGTAQCGSITFPTIPTYTAAAGSGISVAVATSSTNTTTTITLNINGGATQTCTSGQLANSVTGLGIITCQIAVQTIDGVTTSTITFAVSGGASIATTTNSITITAGRSNVSTSTANSWTVLQTFTNGLTANGPVVLASTTNAIVVVNGSGQVAGYAGSACSAGSAPTGISATGTVQTCTAYLTGNQSVTLTISGDATGTASGATSILDSIQVTGLLGKSLPSLATGTLEYTGGAWTLGSLPLTSFNVTCVSGCSVSTTTNSAAITVTGGSGVSTSTPNTWTANQQLSGGATNASGTHIGATYAELVSPVAGEGDFTNIQPAITADCALSSPGIVYVKNGVYDLGSTGLTVSSTCAGFGLIGESESSTRITYEGSGTAINLGDNSGSITKAEVGDFTLVGSSSGLIGINAERAQVSNFHDLYITGFTKTSSTYSAQGKGLVFSGDSTLNADNFISNIHEDHNDIDLLVASTSNANYFTGLDLYGQTNPSSTLILAQNGVGNTFDITNLSSATNGAVINTAGNIVRIGYGELLTNELVYGSGATDNFAILQVFSNVTSTVTDNSTGGTNDTFVMNGNTILASTTITGGGLTVSNGQVNAYNTGNGALNSFRGSTGNYDTQCLGTGTTSWWCWQLSPDGTNNLKLVDSQDGGTILEADRNGTTTVGNAGSGNTTVLNSSTTIVMGTLQDANGNKYPTSTGLSAYNVTSGNTLATVTTTTTSAAVTVTTTPTFAQVTDSGVTANDLILGNGSKQLASYGGASTCANAGLVSAISATGATTCVPSSTQATNLGLGAAGKLGVGPYLGTSGSNLTVSSTLASTTITFGFYNATTTKPYSFEETKLSTKVTAAYADCAEYSGTTTVEIYYNTTLASSGIQQVIIPSLVCGIAGGSTTSFTTSTIPAGAYLYGIVSSTVGTPTFTNFNLLGTKS